MKLLRVRQHGALFLDASGRQMTLRGVNLGGDCKVPWPDGGTNHPSDFAGHRDVSFVGRPFPLHEADEHLGRIARWGFNTLRLLTTWEAVEHRGPGLYDQDYLEYFVEVCRRADEHGLYLVIDFHQDAWSRMSGGDGAPGWTFEAVGLDHTKFDAADAAHVMQARYDYANPQRRQQAYPQMSWGSNYRLPANGIMWTLFWGGRLFTPQLRIDGANVQDFLQDRYCGAMEQVARRVRDLPNVVGFDTLNEPGLGWFDQALSYRHLAASRNNPERPRTGPALAPLDALAIARGVTVTVPTLSRDATGAAVPTGAKTFNAAGVAIWNRNVDCPFEKAGAYRLRAKSVAALNENFFCWADNRRLSITEDAFRPFFHKVAATIRRYQPQWSVFAEVDAFALAAGRRFPQDLPERTVNASHWYDLAALYLKRFDPTDHYDAISGQRERGVDAIGKRYLRQLEELATQAESFRGGAPTLIGEFGIPYDLDEGAASAAWAQGARDGVWAPQVAALSLMYDGLDALRLHSTQWNYTASNRNDALIGDGWNQEDLSIFSRDQQEDAAQPDSGGRAIEGFCRPYARCVQGSLHAARFERARRRFVLRFDADGTIAGCTEIYVPRIQFPDGFVVRFEGVPALLGRSDTDQLVCVQALASGPAWLIIEAVRRNDIT